VEGTAGVLAWPPAARAVSSTFIKPFSPMPTTAMGCLTPGNTPSTTAPPSSTTIAGLTPRSFKYSTMAGALGPLTSSSPEKEKYTSFRGTKPSLISRSAASRMPSSVIFVSSVPRPHSSPSNTSPQKGGCFHPASSTGTTS